ncbi:MAG: iron export ABC transporter permease subunit FetB [Calditrichaeota bacterium]|nr:iron export ABC transporter permease subunit FetB [Calditrichota bacterium]
MEKKIIDLTLLQLLFTYTLVVFVFAIAAIRRLKLGKDIFVSAARMTVQLLILGLVLKFVFAIQSWILVLLIFIWMVFWAAQSVIQRTGIRFKGMYKIVFLSLLVGGGSVTLFFVLGIVHPDPWYDPRYFIPLAGMIMGNSMNGSALALERFYSDVKQNRLRIETLLSLGATSSESSGDAFQKGFRAALLPPLMAMSSMGIVSIPGMMTGQILSGTPPMIAVKYQIAIMTAILGTVALNALLILHFERKLLFNKYHQLQID